jgi:hypothetical protein
VAPNRKFCYGTGNDAKQTPSFFSAPFELFFTGPNLNADERADEDQGSSGKIASHGSFLLHGRPLSPKLVPSLNG